MFGGHSTRFGGQHLLLVGFVYKCSVTYTTVPRNTIKGAQTSGSHPRPVLRRSPLSGSRTHKRTRETRRIFYDIVNPFIK